MMNLAAHLAEGVARLAASDVLPDEHMPDFLRQHCAWLKRMPFCVTPEDAAAAEDVLTRTARGSPIGSDRFDAALRGRLTAYYRSAVTR